MKHFTADSRDGTAFGSSCDTCCCARIRLRAGETDIMVLNYAPWIVPIGNGAQLMPQLDFAYEYDDSGCSNSQIDGFGPPAHTSETVTTAANTPVEIDLSDTGTATPAGNTFTYRVHPNAGPSRGAITPLDGQFTDQPFDYAPAAGWNGDDIIWFDQKDAQGRINTFPMRIRTGTGGPVIPIPTNAIRVNQADVRVNGHLYEASFPISMPPGTPECVMQRMTVKATARDCDGRLFTHFMCFDLTTGKC